MPLEEESMPPRLTGMCLVSDGVRRLAGFYESVLEIEAQGDEQYSYFDTGAVQLSIFSTQGTEGMAPGATAGAGTGRWLIEFRVADVDAEHARLVALGVAIVKPPTTQPWGMRSVWFRDPDGNMVDLFAPVASAS
jgi:predicted enzyme related to lactoylglutathione lyase